MRRGGRPSCWPPPCHHRPRDEPRADGCGYRAHVGQDVAEANGKRPKPRRLEANPVLLAEVLRRLKKRNSPEQIAGRLVEISPTIRRCGCHTQRCTKQSTSSYEGNWPGWSRPRCAPAGRNEKLRAAPKPVPLEDMIGISERPAEAEDRAIPGHWEGDLILGSTASAQRSAPWSNAPPDSWYCCTYPVIAPRGPWPTRCQPRSPRSPRSCAAP